MKHPHDSESCIRTRRASIPRRSGDVRVLLAMGACIALQMTAFVMTLPLFARRFAEFGAGIEALGTSAITYALAGTLAAPLMGTLADRLGRRRIVLTSLCAYVLAFAGYLVAHSALQVILIRTLEGALTAGLIPAVGGLVADLAPADRRAQWMGIVSGGASVGWIAGPILGGVLYDRWGYDAALQVAVGAAALTFALAAITIPALPRRGHAPIALEPPDHSGSVGRRTPAWARLRATMPASLPAFLVLLAVTFSVMFAWAFIEPRFMFHAYDDLGWTSSMLGLVMSTFGGACMLGEFALGRLSDRLGRKPVILAGLVLFTAQFIGLAFFRDYVWIAVSFVIAGLGNSLFDPALSAAFLDVAPVGHQARTMGFKSTAGSIGNILGPALVVTASPILEARWIFLGATGIVAAIALLFACTRTGTQTFPGGPVAAEPLRP